ncbi:hypothetical protein ACQ4M4_23860 [Leptolyngbya sp. AN02str]|uniref:hypothetical protein n=1 Tax=Leptolyngbya sp. AN02str TaxID=3423363 RepID=UPI003D31A9D1
MTPSAYSPNDNLQQVANHILESRQISRADQRCFMSAALSDQSLTRDDQQMVERVFDALHRGMLKIID